jgi:transposase
MARMAILENDLADKNLLIANHTSVIAERETSISGLRTELTERETSIPKLTGDLQAAMFQLEQLRRMIFGSKRERFVSNQDINQLRIEFEPKSAEIEESVKAEREKIRVEYERKKPKKEHHGRMALPAHLPVVETIIEPTEDTTGMVYIGKDVTEELDYTPETLHINRFSL